MRVGLDIEEKTMPYDSSEKARTYAREWKRKKREDPEFRENEYELNRKYRASNSESISEQKKGYYLDNKETLKELKRIRHRERAQRKVKWDNELTRLVLVEARHLCTLRKEATGIDWSIDHEIPLKGKNISGLDVWNNIQVIPKLQNHRKYNNYATDWS